MPPLRSKGKQPAKPKNESLRFFPTPETQALYNAYRQLQEQASQTQPVSPVSSQTFAITTPESEDRQPPTKRQKAQPQGPAQRNGPLEAVKRAHAALMRKIGACHDCSSRRVQCGHFDSMRFEQGYQAQRLNPEPIPRVYRPQSSPTPPIPQGYGAGGPATLPVWGASGQEATGPSFAGNLVVPRPSYTGAASGSVTPVMALHQGIISPTYFAHTGSWESAMARLGQWEGFNDDIGDIELSVPGEARPMATGSAIPVPPRTPIPYGIPDRAYQGAMVQAAVIPGNLAALGTEEMVLVDVRVARKVEIPNSTWWECQHGEGAIRGSNIEICSKRSPSLESAIGHFEYEHGALQSHWPAWRCRNQLIRTRGGMPTSVYCDTLWSEDHDPRAGFQCAACRGRTWELWEYGELRTPSRSTSSVHGRVVSRDDAFSNTRNSNKRPAAAAFPDQAGTSGFWPGRDMGGPYCGSQRSHRNAKAIVHGVRRRAKQWESSRRWGPDTAPVLAIMLFGVCVFCTLWLVPFLWRHPLWLAPRLAWNEAEVTRAVISWGPASCLLAGMVLTWLGKHIQSRRCHQRSKMLYADSEQMCVEDWCVASGYQVHRRTVSEP